MESQEQIITSSRNKRQKEGIVNISEIKKGQHVCVANNPAIAHHTYIIVGAWLGETGLRLDLMRADDESIKRDEKAIDCKVVK